MNVNWIFFDVGGVLMDDSESEEWRKKNILKIASFRNPKITREDIDNAFYQGSSFVGNTDDNTIKVLFPDKKISEELMKEAKKSRSARWPTMKEFAERSPFTPDVLEVVEELSKKYNLGIIANQPKEINDRLENLGLLKYFKALGMSHAVGLHKPDPELYKMILKEAGAIPEKSVMIDDNIERGLVPAHNLGMKTIWFDWGFRKEMPYWVDYKIKSLKDLLSILE